MARQGKKQWRKPLIWTPLNLDTSLTLAFFEAGIGKCIEVLGIGNATFLLIFRPPQD